jgi:lipid-A-disaccharide synthase-like uncharacterized protein
MSPQLLQIIFLWFQAHLSAWDLFGLFGQSMFMMRFIYQWIATERAKKSVVPEAFWYFSLAGGLMVLIYAVHLQNIPFMAGQGSGLIIYTRNVYFIQKHKRVANA